MVDLSLILDQLEFRISGGETNTNVFQSIGGPMSNVLPEAKIVDNVFDNLWDDVTVQERVAGETSYRWIYFFNNSVETITSLRMYFSPADAFVTATWIKGGPMVVPDLQPDEHTAPPADEVGSADDTFPAFTQITDSYDTTKEITNQIGPMQWQAICLKRTLPPNTDSSIRTQYRLVIESRD